MRFILFLLILSGCVSEPLKVGDCVSIGGSVYSVAKVGLYGYSVKPLAHPEAIYWVPLLDMKISWRNADCSVQGNL